MTIKWKDDGAFKERAVQLSCDRSSTTELASELGVLPDRIYCWCKEFADYDSVSFLGHSIDRLNDDGRRAKEMENKLKDRQVMCAFIDWNLGRYGEPRIAA